MDLFKKEGVRTIYLEGIDQSYVGKDIDAYLKPGGTMSKRLQKLIEHIDDEYKNEPRFDQRYSTMRVFEAAKASGLNIAGTDFSFAPQHRTFDFNYYASLTIRETQASRPPEEKYIALAGRLHTSGSKRVVNGKEDLHHGGISNYLGIRSLHVNAEPGQTMRSVATGTSAEQVVTGSDGSKVHFFPHITLTLPGPG